MFYGWWVVGACFLVSLYTGGIVFFGFTAIFEPLASEFGWSYTQISFAASLRGVELGLLAPIVGLLVDRWGPRRLLFAGAIFIGLGFVLLSRINSLGMFYASFFIIAIGISISAATVMMTAVVNWFRKKVAIATGIVASGFALGGLLVPLVAILIDTSGWRMVMFILGLGMWVIGIPLSLLVRHKPEHYGYLPDGEPSTTTSVNESPGSPQNAEVDVQAKQAIKSRAFWHLSLALMFQGMAIQAVITHVMPYLSSIGIARSTSSIIASATPLASIGGRLGFGWLGDRLDKRWLTTAGLALSRCLVYIRWYGCCSPSHYGNYSSP
ncbi:MFS transporter [Chloroflexota bacterium]